MAWAVRISEYRSPMHLLLPMKSAMPSSIGRSSITFHFFFFNDTATTEIYTLSLHDALPISARPLHRAGRRAVARRQTLGVVPRSEEHTSELQSRRDLVCRLLLENKKK